MPVAAHAGGTAPCVITAISSAGFRRPPVAGSR